MRKWILVGMALGILWLNAGDVCASEKKNDKKKNEKKEAPEPSKYDKLVKKATTVAKSDFITLHKVNGKLYFELPLRYLEREMLLASTVSSVSDNELCSIGYKLNDPLHVKFTRTDSTIYMKKVNTWATYNPSEKPLKKAYEQNYMDPILFVYPIEAYNQDSSAVVIDMTTLFTSDEPLLSSLPGGVGMISVISALNAKGTSLGDIKAFDDNVSIKTNFTYTVSLSFLGMFTIRDKEPMAINATRSLLLLPEEKMHPRISDSRLGVFLTEKTHLTTGEDQLQTYSLAHRWRLEPKDMAAYERGELVEPVKPIVFYLDDAFPALWREPIREGATRWNKAFEKIGFKNAVRVLDFPVNDPTFDPDNLKYSCIRYVPSAEANAMGPSWVDPSSGEIINASVIIYNDVVRLINRWRFVQTAQIDPSVRSKKMPDNIMEESIAYVVAHEIGHCLGFMHNMGASAAYPVDSLRSATFTQKLGTTPSIMDYARFNYVAQPGDKGVKLTPPDLGVYDDFIVKWNYQPLPKAANLKEETAILESWIDEKVGDPRFRYGRQQIGLRCDPSAIEEDLGNDPMKAGEYGIKNLQYITKHLNEWINNDNDFSHREDLLNEITMQYYRYVKNVMYNIGGIYLTDAKEGTGATRHQCVPKEMQKASLAWVIRQVKACDWLDRPELKEKFDLRISSPTIVQQALVKELMKSYKNVILSAHMATDPYTLKMYFDDLYAGIWENTIKGGSLTEGDKMLQRLMIDQIKEVIAPDEKKGNFSFFQGGDYIPSVEELVAYRLDETGTLERHIDKAREIEMERGKGYVASQMEEFGKSYGWQYGVRLTPIDRSKEYLYMSGSRIKLLLESQVNTPDPETRAHYRTMLFTLNKALNGK